MATFLGSLRTNEVYSALFNMILSQQNFADNLQKHQTLVEQAKEEAGLFGDTKLYYSSDVLSSQVWGADGTHPKGGVQDVEASNLLNVARAKAPECQALVIDCFRIIALTTDEYMSKRAWSTESAFADFTSIMIGWMNDTRKVYEGTLYNAFIGSTETSTGKQQVAIDLRSASSGQPLYGLTGVEKRQMEGMLIAQDLADLLVEMGDYSRDFNDYQHLRSYAEDNIKFVFNAAHVNAIRNVDLPTIFHKEGLESKFEKEIMPARYFGVELNSSTIATYSASTPAAGKPIDSDDGSYVPGVGHANGCVRSRVEKVVTVSATDYHVFPGDEIPAGATVGSGKQFDLGEAYIEDPTIICKVLVKIPPMLSAFSASTSFYNPRALITNRYLIWGHNTLEYLKNYPLITVRASL